MGAPDVLLPTEHCPHCGAPAGAAFCAECGRRTGAAKSAVDRTAAPGRASTERSQLLLLGVGTAVIAVLAAAGILAAQLLPRGADVRPGSVTPSTGSAEASPSTSAAPLSIQVSASCESPASVDGRGQPTSYGPTRAVDGDDTTAWRCPGSGVGERLTVQFSAPVSLTGVGLIPGLAKTDPADGTDRYAQNNRISLVRLTVDSGVLGDFTLDTSPFNRSVQDLPLTEPVVTSEVTVTVLASVPGTEQNRQQPIDSMAISELQLS